jgi:molecular chaperone GrpE
MSQSTESTGPESLENEVSGSTAAPETENSASADEINYRERYMYLAAEFENTKKRFERDRLNTLKFANQDLMKDLISSLDLFDLTLTALRPDQDPKIKNIVVGIDMVQKQLLDAMKKHGLEKVNALGQAFDPNLHEAMDQEVNDQVPEGQVLREHCAAYLLAGRLLRAAKVVVARAPTASTK